MLRVDCYYFFELSIRLHPLRQLAADYPVRDCWGVIWQAKNDLNAFFEIFPLRISREPASRVYRALSKIVPEEFAGIKIGDEESGWQKISYLDAQEIRDSIAEFETVLKAELSNFDTYFVSQKGSFSTPDLIARAEIMLPESTRLAMPQGALDDMREAGRCLAFNLGTATGFHILRATESVIRQYYEATVGELPALKIRNWGAYIRNMRRCGKAQEKILAMMEHIKDSYRNPVLHPEDKVTPDEAMILMSLCNSLITMIEAEIPKVPSPQLALAMDVAK